MPFKPTIEYADFAKLDLRVATILAAEPHPNADRLVKVQIDLGSEQRQVLAGIRQYCGDVAALVGRQIVVVANLAPRKIRGEESNGMLLAASVMAPPPPPPPPEVGAEEGAAEGAPPAEPQIADIVLLTPAKPVPPGATIS